MIHSNASTGRRFGQNFLDDEMSEKIAEDLPCALQDEILEIGAGHGALTAFLLPKCAKLTAVEIDNFCIPKLQERFKGESKFNLIHKNFLQFDFENFLTKNENNLWVVGNLPYNMATAIILKILPFINSSDNFKGCMFMTQLEVAERITANAGTSGYGSLSVFVAANANARIIRTINPKHFTPKPKVNSATILLTPLEYPPLLNSVFFNFVRRAFSQKRKTLANSLSEYYEKEKVFEVLQALTIKENVRAEQLSLQEFISIFSKLK
ncbi:ribosomal RNA small subunit methyltransferase A [Fibrobacterales bacterium]|nr:ribosomal RNA small subunit methyltransferase A [Fibrobacterales bacterium]